MIDMPQESDLLMESRLVVEYSLFRDWAAILRRWHDRGGAESPGHRDELLREIIVRLIPVVSTLGPDNRYLRFLSDIQNGDVDLGVASNTAEQVQFWLRRTTAAVCGCLSDEMNAVRRKFPFLDPPFVAGELGSIGEYGVLSVLGAGGMGVIFEAYQKGGDHKPNRVALKTISPNTKHPDSEERFESEKSLLNRLKGSPNIVQMTFSGSTAAVRYIVMDYVFGPTLHDLLEVFAGQPMPVLLVLDLICQILTGVESAHSMHPDPIIHRDLKPANVFLERVQGASDAKEGWRVRIGDFGLAKSQAMTALTKLGVIMGSQDYMAPEQFRSGTACPKTDVYAIGVMALQMLVGELPQESLRTSPRSIRAKLKERNMSPGFAEWIIRMLNSKQDQRPRAIDVRNGLFNIQKKFNPVPVRAPQSPVLKKEVAFPSKVSVPKLVEGFPATDRSNPNAITVKAVSTTASQDAASFPTVSKPPHRWRLGLKLSIGLIVLVAIFAVIWPATLRGERLKCLDFSVKVTSQDPGSIKSQGLIIGGQGEADKWAVPVIEKEALTLEAKFNFEADAYLFWGDQQRFVPLYPWNGTRDGGSADFAFRDLNADPPRIAPSAHIFSPNQRALKSGYRVDATVGLDKIILLANRSGTRTLPNAEMFRRCLESAPRRQAKPGEWSIVTLDQDGTTLRQNSESRGPDGEIISLDDETAWLKSLRGEFDVVVVVSFAHEALLPGP
jgi:serine/threonine protein kinase